MKRILLFCALLLGSTQLFAQGRFSALLRVRLNNGAPIMVTVDGRHYDQRGRAITIGGLPRGRHRIAVYKLGRGYGAGRPRLVYEGTVRTEPGTFTTCMVDPWRNAIAIRIHDMDRDYNTNQDWYNRQDDYADNDGPGRNEGYNNDRPYSDREPDNVYDNGGTEINRDNDGRNGYNDAPVAASGMSSRDLSDLQQRVAARMTDTDKEKLLKTALKGKVYSTADITAILGWLSFDSTRLDFAKWAYANVSDRQNYYKVEDALSFSGSKTELDNFINGSR